jgi:hypothetical protein
MVSPAWLEQATCGLGMRPKKTPRLYKEIGQDLARLVDAWPKLAEPLKRAIMAIVEASEMGK